MYLSRVDKRGTQMAIITNRLIAKTMIYLKLFTENTLL